MTTSADEKLGTFLGRQKKTQRQIEATEKEGKKAAQLQAETLAAQEAKEKMALAESTSEVEERRARAKMAGGRSLLIKTSPRGVQSLGGV
jgi:hypothetical protein